MHDGMPVYVSHDFHSIMRMEPTEFLLEICPLTAIPEHYGCVGRREVHARRENEATFSAVRIAPNTTESAEERGAKAGSWLQNMLGNAEYPRELGTNHSNIMNRRFDLNARYRNAFMVSPTVPWRQEELANADYTSNLALAQFTITVIMLSIDTNIPQTVAADDATTRRRRGPLPHTDSTVPSRLLLTVADSQRSGKPEQESLVQATISEITSLRNYDNIARVVCNKQQVPFAHCELLRLKKRVPLDVFCLSEVDFVSRMQDEFRRDLMQSSHDTISHIQITSVLKRGFEHTCQTQATRRLLQEEEVVITCAVGTQQRYQVALDVLIQLGYGNISILTQSVPALQVCDSTISGSCRFSGTFVTQTLYESETDINSDDSLFAGVIIAIVVGVFACVAVFLCVFSDMSKSYQKAQPAHTVLGAEHMQYCALNMSVPRHH